MASVASAITRLRAIHSDMDDTQALSYLNIANNEICHKFRLFTTEESLTALVAGTPEYAINTLDARVYAVTYVRSSATGDVKPLVAVRWEDKIAEQPTFHHDPDSEPAEYAIHRGSTGLPSVYLWPAPVTASSGGYPKLTIHASRVVDLVSLGDLPSGMVAVEDAFVWLAASKWSADRKRFDEAVAYNNLWERWFNDQASANDKRAVQSPTRRTPRIFFPGVT